MHMLIQKLCVNSRHCSINIHMLFIYQVCKLGTIKGFHHNIDTGNSPPVYRLPYRKSPAELAAIQAELQKMLKSHIIKPSFSTWGAPCILVRKPPQKGLPQSPRFVVDYRGAQCCYFRGWLSHTICVQCFRCPG